MISLFNRPHLNVDIHPGALNMFFFLNFFLDNKLDRKDKLSVINEVKNFHKLYRPTIKRF